MDSISKCIDENNIVNSNVTDIVKSWYSGSISNYGVILKWSSSIEYNQSSSVEPDMSLFSVDNLNFQNIYMYT